MQNLLSSILFATFAFLALSAEECGKSHYIADSGFDIWCGDRLCDWDLESGAVARAASWHKDDYSVELIGSDVLISQLSTRGATSCLRFELLADIEDDARVTLMMDFFDDGVVEYRQELGHVRWESLVYYVTTPPTWRGVRFSLHKEGPGRARLAQIEATEDTACIDKPIELVNRPIGASCQNGAECASALCLDSVSVWDGKVCSACERDEDCQPDMVCGVARQTPYHLGLALSCIPKNTKPLGTLCVGDTECLAGFCHEGSCSECRDADDCGDGDFCARATHEKVELPALCSSDGAGSLCIQDSDCQSGSCQGGDDLRICTGDGRECESDAECAGGNWLLDSDCVTIGIDSGTCQ